MSEVSVVSSRISAALRPFEHARRSFSRFWSCFDAASAYTKTEVKDQNTAAAPKRQSSAIKVTLIRYMNRPTRNIPSTPRTYLQNLVADCARVVVEVLRFKRLGSCEGHSVLQGGAFGHRQSFRCEPAQYEDSTSHISTATRLTPVATCTTCIASSNGHKTTDVKL